MDESDVNLRSRLLYVTGDQRVLIMSGKQLEDFAAQFNLRRRRWSELGL